MSRCLPRLLIFVVVIALATVTPMAAQVRAIPDDNLAYPVLLLYKNGGNGSGFYLSTTSEIFLVTAKHVIFEPITQRLNDISMNLVSYSKDPNDPMSNVIALDLEVLQKTGEI